MIVHAKVKNYNTKCVVLGVGCVVALTPAKTWPKYPIEPVLTFVEYRLFFVFVVFEKATRLPCFFDNVIQSHTACARTFLFSGNQRRRESHIFHKPQASAVAFT